MDDEISEKNEEYDFSTTPQIDLEKIKELMPGIDLSKPMTKETAEELNYAFINNNTFPEGTLVKINWNEETKKCELSVHCSTGFATAEIADKFDIGQEWWDKGYINQDCRLVDLCDLNEFRTNSFGLIETHTFEIPTDGNLENAFLELDKKLSEEKWSYKLINDDQKERVSLADYRTLFTKSVGHEPTVFEYDGPYDEGYIVNDDSQLTAYNEYATMDGYISPEKSIELIHKRECKEIANKVGSIIGGNMGDIAVDFQNGKYVVNIYGLEYEFDSKDIKSLNNTVDEVYDAIYQGINEDESGKYDLLKAQVYINEHITNKDKITAGDINFLTDVVVNEDGTYSYIPTDESDFYNIYAKKYNITISKEDLKDFGNPNGPIRAIINAANFQNELSSGSNDASIMLHQVDNKFVYECIVNGETKYFVSENGLYFESSSNGEIIDEKHHQFDITEYYKKNNSQDKSYYNNPKLSRRQNSGICSPDEVRYRRIIENLNKIDVQQSINPENLSTAIATINRYYTTKASSAVTAVRNLDNDITILSKLIDSIVNLYTIHDADMKEILDGLVTGTDNSFADKVFGMFKTNGTTYNKEKFEAEFINGYNNFLNEVKDDLLIYHKMNNGEIPITLPKDSSKENYPEFIKLIEDAELDPAKIIVREKDGTYYLKYEDYEKIFKTYIDNPDKLFVSPEMHSMFISDPSIMSAWYANNYEEIGQCIKNYNNLSAIKDYVPYLFEDGYSNELEYVRKNGKTSAGFTNDWMTPAELAMYQHLCTNHFDLSHITDETGSEIEIKSYSKAGSFRNAISPMLNEREGRYNAAEQLLEMIKNGVGLEDYLSRGFTGIFDGFTKTIKNMYYAFDHNTLSYDWKNYYLTKFISEEYDISKLMNSYASGQISDKEFELGKKLSGNKPGQYDEEGNYQISKSQKVWLQGSYELGDTIGDSVFQLALMSSTSGSAVLARIARYGTIAVSTFGENMNKNWGSIIQDDSGEYWELFGKSALKAGLKTGLQAANDVIRAKIKTKYKPSTSSTPSVELVGEESLGSSKKTVIDFTKNTLDSALETIKKTKYGEKILAKGVPGGLVVNAFKKKDAGGLYDLAVALSYKALSSGTDSVFDDGDFSKAAGKGAEKAWRDINQWDFGKIIDSETKVDDIAYMIFRGLIRGSAGSWGTTSFGTALAWK